jgi:sugar lactone lactonase YvrE
VSRGAAAALLALLLAPARASATIHARTADVVLGQYNFTATAANSADASGFVAPNQVVIDTATGRLFAVDGIGHRVLWWNDRSSLTNGQAADGVLGQPDVFGTGSAVTAARLNFPSGLALDGAGSLWVADAGNQRVLRFSKPFSSGMSADLVIGQNSFTTRGAAATNVGMNNPIGVAFGPDGWLWAADSVNNRALGYAPPFTTGMSATYVLGQSSFDVSGAALTQTGMNYAYSVAVATDGTVFVADQSNKRVLGFVPPLSNGMGATFALGETNFTSNGGGATASLAGSANGVGVDASGNLWYGDDGNHRLLMFAAPFSTGMAATNVIGQANFTASGNTVTASGFWNPRIAHFDGTTGALWVGDASNHRVMRFTPPFTNGMSADLELGQGDFTHAAANRADAQGINNPRQVTVDTNTARVYLVDQNNGRVLFWNDLAALTSGKAADGVLGQPNFADVTGAAAANKFQAFATGVAVDGSGSVWVSEQSCQRVLKFAAPVTSGMNASLVLGAAGLTACSGGTSATQFTNPAGVAFDAAGGVWVADAGNHRVLRFAAPQSNGMAATTVLGQAGYGTGAAGLSASALNSPYGVAVDSSGAVWVGDSSNGRALMFPSPQTDGMSATVVLGQAGFVSSAAATTQTAMRNPFQLAFDPSGNLWVGDNFGKRVLGFSPPFVNGGAASIVLGQPNFTSNGGSASASHLGNVYGLAVSSAGDVVAAETDDQRALVFFAPAPPHLGVGASSSTSVTWSWTAVSSATGYQFWPSTGGPAISLAASSTSLTQIGLSTNTAYSARLQALYSYGAGPLTPTTTVRTAVSQSIGAGGGFTSYVQPAGTVSLIIPPGAFATTVGVTLQAPSLLAAPAAFGTAPTPTEIGAEIVLDQAVQPLVACRLSIGYRDVDVAGLNPAALVIARYDPAAGVWTPLPGTVDAAARTVTASVGHFSTFQLMAGVAAASVAAPRAFPNPFRPALGHLSVTFANLPAGAAIQIFDVAGRKVKELQADAAGLAAWDGTNAAGARVASAVYFVVARGAGGTKTFKVIVQR